MSPFVDSVPTLEGRPDERREALLRALRQVPADVYSVFEVAACGEGWCYADATAIGDATAVAFRLRMKGRPFVGPWDPTLPPRGHDNRFRAGIDGWGTRDEDLARFEIWREYYEEIGFRWERRLLLYEGDRFVSWIGLTRFGDRPCFDRDELRSLGRLTPLIRRLGLAEDAARLRDRPSAQLHVVLRADGSTEYACGGAKPWLDPARASLLAAATRRLDIGDSIDVIYVDGMVARPVRLLSEGSGARYLWLLNPSRTPQRSPLGWLSPRAREVADLAAAGATLPEIARHLGIGVETVREHLKRAYLVLGVACRVELARALSG